MTEFAKRSRVRVIPATCRVFGTAVGQKERAAPIGSNGCAAGSGVIPKISAPKISARYGCATDVAVAVGSHNVFATVVPAPG